MARLYKPKQRAGTSDLEILHPDRLVRVGSEQWTVHEYSLRDAARYHALGERLLAGRAKGQEDPEAMVLLLAQATGKDPIQVAGLDDESFSALVAAWDEVNAPLFKTAEIAPGKPAGARWADVYETLIASGHSLAEIGSYTARQIELFLSAAMRRHNRLRADTVIDTNAGFGGGNHANDHIRNLTKGPA